MKGKIIIPAGGIKAVNKYIQILENILTGNCIM